MTSADPRIEALRARIVDTKNRQCSRNYLGPEKRSIANAAQVFFQDSTATEKIAVEYPIGHRRPRAEGIPVLRQKAESAFAAHYGSARSTQLMALFADRVSLEAMSVHEFMKRFAKVKIPGASPRA